MMVSVALLVERTVYKRGRGSIGECNPIQLAYSTSAKMAPAKDLQYWTDELSRVRCRLLYALGSALSSSSSVANQTMIPDSVNEVFRVLEGFNDLNSRRFEDIESLLKQPIEAGESTGENEQEGGKCKKPFARYRKEKTVTAPGNDEDTESEDITKCREDEDCIEVEIPVPVCEKTVQEDADEIEVDLQPPLRCRARSQAASGKTPVKKRNVRSRVDKEEAQKDKRHKKVPCNRCSKKKKDQLTDGNGFFDQVAFGKWLKEGRCLKSEHVSREMTLPRPQPLGIDMYKMTFDETETLPPFE